MNKDEGYVKFIEGMSLLAQGDISGVDVLKEAAEMGNPYAQNNYALILMTGDLVYKDVDEAHKWFMKAAERGIDESQFYLGLAYYEGVVLEQDHAEALKWFRIAAEKGYPRAQYYMGLCYFNGNGVFRDFESAIRWFTMASDKGLSMARIALADAYSDLHNPSRDYKKAFHLYKLASGADDVKGHYKLGMCYYKGKGTPQNYIEASKCFRKGADPHRDPDCEFMLAMMYIKGEGVQRNRNYAIALLSHAAITGNEQAKRYLDMIAPNGALPQNLPPLQEDEPSEVFLNTPDIIAGIKGAERNDKSKFSFRKKKRDV